MDQENNKHVLKEVEMSLSKVMNKRAENNRSLEISANKGVCQSAQFRNFSRITFGDNKNMSRMSYDHMPPRSTRGTISFQPPKSPIYGGSIRVVDTDNYDTHEDSSFITNGGKNPLQDSSRYSFSKKAYVTSGPNDSFLVARSLSPKE